MEWGLSSELRRYFLQSWGGCCLCGHDVGCCRLVILLSTQRWTCCCFHMEGHLIGSSKYLLGEDAGSHMETLWPHGLLGSQWEQQVADGGVVHAVGDLVSKESQGWWAVWSFQGHQEVQGSWCSRRSREVAGVEVCRDWLCQSLGVGIISGIERDRLSHPHVGVQMSGLSQAADARKAMGGVGGIRHSGAWVPTEPLKGSAALRAPVSWGLQRSAEKQDELPSLHDCPMT